MHKLYITKLPETPGMKVVYAIREACQALTQSAVGFAEASDRMAAMQRRDGLPYYLGYTDDDGALSKARLVLAQAGVLTRLDLTEEERTPQPQPPSEEAAPAQAVSYNSARVALVALRLSNGDPAMALHHCALLSNAVGETPEQRGVCMEAAGILLDTFPPGLMEAIREIITHYTGVKTEDAP